MAYCPQCGSEQNCGCDVCHRCGVPLVEKAQGPPKARTSTLSIAEEVRAGAVREGETPTATSAGLEGESELEITTKTGRAVIPLLLLILGCGILLIALIEMIHATSDFVGPGGGTGGAPAIKHVGYYLGHLFYSGSVRFITGFAVTAAALFYAPPLPFKKRDNWRPAIIVLSSAMGIVSLCCLISAILIVLPGSVSLLVRELLPSPAVSVSVFLAMGLSLLAGSYVITRWLKGDGGRVKVLKVSNKKR